jgi:hypothetical protein
MNHHNSLKKEIVLTATVLIIVAAMTTTIVGNNAFARNPQGASPANPCGNQPLSSNIRCENIASQADGNDNFVNLNSSRSQG